VTFVIPAALNLLPHPFFLVLTLASPRPLPPFLRAAVDADRKKLALGSLCRTASLRPGPLDSPFLSVPTSTGFAAPSLLNPFLKLPSRLSIRSFGPMVPNSRALFTTADAFFLNCGSRFFSFLRGKTAKGQASVLFFSSSADFPPFFQ